MTWAKFTKAYHPTHPLYGTTIYIDSEKVSSVDAIDAKSTAQAAYWGVSGIGKYTRISCGQMYYIVADKLDEVLKKLQINP